MKNDLTELVMILDRSGSMLGLEEDTIGGFNSMIEKQKKEEGEAYVTTVLFDDQITLVHDRVDLKKVEPMTDKEYYVRGCTALLDAVGTTIRHIDVIQKHARSEDVPGKTIFVITTDGMENASREFTYEEIRRLIEQHRECQGWEFIFLGANMDAVTEAGRLGIRSDRAATYENDEEGTALNYRVLSSAVGKLRRASRARRNFDALYDEDENNDGDLLAEIRSDYSQRHKK